MKTVLRSKQEYTSFANEVFKIIVTVETTDTISGVNATLAIYKERSIGNSIIYTRIDSLKNYSKDFTTEEVKALEDSLTFEEGLTSRAKSTLIQLETAKQYIETDGLFIINGVLLVEDDFEIVTINEQLY